MKTYISGGILIFFLFLLSPMELFSQGCSFEISVVPVHVKCNGLNTGSAEVFESPGGTYSYLWSTGETSSSVENLEAGTYFVKVSDLSGCEIINFITITEPPKVETEAVLSHPVCFGHNSGSIDLSVSGGVQPYSYTWSNNVKTASNPDIYSGIYTCTIRDANYCETIEGYELVQPDVISTFAEVKDVRGFGLSDGSINISCSGGVHPYQYYWTDSSGFSAQVEDIYAVPSSTYALNIVDSKSCSYDTSIFVPEPPPLELSSEITDVFCNAYSDGIIEVLANGGVPPYSYIWANEEIILTENTSRLGDLSMGKYFLRLIDNNGISLRDSFIVDQPQSIVANVVTEDAYCYDSLNGSAVLTVSGGNPPFTFLWSNGSFDQNIERLHAGDYEVEIVDSKGCFFKVKTNIGEPDSIEINTIVKDISCKDHHNGKVYTDVVGGIPPYIYDWSNGEINDYIEMLDVGVYEIVVRDAHDCPMTTSAEVSKPLFGCIEIPNAFTPNGDLINDAWVIQNSYLYPDIEVMVMNKEGYEVFYSIAYAEDWDGKYHDHDAAPGTYYYVVDLHNGDPVYKGIVTIIR